MATEETYLAVPLRKIARGAGIAFTGSIVGMAFSYFSRMIIARFLGAADYGLISLSFAGMTIGAALASMGLPAGIVRYVSFYNGREDEGKIKGTIIGALKISTPVSIIFALLFFFGADWASLHIFHEPSLTPVLRIFSIGIPFWVLATNFISATIGFQDLRYRVYVNDLFQNILKLAAIVVFLVLGFGVIGAAWGWIVAVIGMPFLAFYFLERKVFSIFDSKVKAASMERELISFSWPLILTSIVGMIMAYTDTLMLGYFSTAADVGIYNTALPTASLLGVVGHAFAAIFMPVASELYAKNREEELRGIYSTATKWILSVTLPGFLLMALFANAILGILFGAEFIAAGPALSILAFSFFVTLVLGLTFAVLQVYGRTKIVMGCISAGAGANFILNFLLIPIYGIMGAAVATSISTILASILSLFFVFRIGKMQPFKKSNLKPVMASLLAVSIVYAVTKYVIGVSIPSLIGMLFVFLLLYFFLLLLFKSFEEEDLMMMRLINQSLGTKSNWIAKIIQRFL